MLPREALSHAEKALLEHAAVGRTTHRAGALTACLAGGEADALMHVAVPSGPEPNDWGPSVADLVALRTTHGTVPRLEFMAELHPGLPAALEREGFVRASADPVMTVALTEVEGGDTAAPGAYRRLGAGDPGLLAAFVETQASAFGMPPATGYAFLERLRTTLASGAVMAAVLLEDGAPTSGAVLQLGGAGWAELAGVFTARTRRRRGGARHVCRRLLTDAAAAGVTHAWLSAAEDARGLYGRLGFVAAGTQLNYRYAPFSVLPAGDGI